MKTASIQVLPKAQKYYTLNDTMLSSQTAPFKASPGSPKGQLSVSDMGFPSTPPCQMLKLPDEVAMDMIVMGN